METWIKIDELRPIVDSLNSEKITYGKAIELITEYCRGRVEPSKLSQHDVIKNEVSVCDYPWHTIEVFTDGCCSKCHQYR